MPELAEGDIVNITITGATVRWIADDGDRVEFLLDDGRGFGSIPGGFSLYLSEHPHVTVEATR